MLQVRCLTGDSFDGTGETDMIYEEHRRRSKIDDGPAVHDSAVVGGGSGDRRGKFKPTQASALGEAYSGVGAHTMMAAALHLCCSIQSRPDWEIKGGATPGRVCAAPQR